VVDEAQDLSPMQWRMIGRRGQHATWTIVGDPLQSSWPDTAEALAAKDAALGTARSRNRFTLRVNYRNSAEIFDLAAQSLGDMADPADLPNAVRTTGIEPTVRRMARTDLPTAISSAAAALLIAVDGTVGVITPMDMADEVRDLLRASISDRLRVVGSLESKGMEYDAVVVVHPEGIIAESSTGRRTLYVALTRATQHLTVLATSDSWLPDPV
jgi:DNA helicase IV